MLECPDCNARVTNPTTRWNDCVVCWAGFYVKVRERSTREMAECYKPLLDFAFKYSMERDTGTLISRVE